MKINIQLFAEKTIPEGNPFSRLFQGKEPKEETKVEPTEEPKVEVKAEELKEEPKEELKEEPREPEVKETVEEFDEIVHNKQKVKIPVSERKTYLQKGYNYDHVKEESDTAKQTLARVAKMEGFDKTEDYLAELDKREKLKLVDQIEEAGDDTDAIDEIIKNHPIVRQTAEEKETIAKERQEMERSKKIDVLKKDQFFKELEPELNQLLEQNPTADPDLVYSVLVGNYVRTGKLAEMQKKTDELVNSTKASTEKKVLADIHDKERRSMPSGGDSTDGKDLIQSTPFGDKMAGIFGLSKDARQKAAQRAHEKLKGR